VRYSYYFDNAKNLVVVKKVGPVTVAEDIEFINKVLADPKFRKGMSSTSDLTEAVYDWSMQDIDKFRSYVSSILDRLGKCKWALISKGGITTTNARLFILLHDVNVENLKIKLFSNNFDAIKWLSSSE
jgi:hypothetical protein